MIQQRGICSYNRTVELLPWGREIQLRGLGRRLMSQPMKYSIFQDWSRIPHCGKTQDIHDIADLEGGRLLREYVQAFTLHLKKNCITHLLVSNHATDFDSVA